MKFAYNSLKEKCKEFISKKLNISIENKKNSNFKIEYISFNKIPSSQYICSAMFLIQFDHQTYFNKEIPGMDLDAIKNLIKIGEKEYLSSFATYFFKYWVLQKMGLSKDIIIKYII